MIRLCILAAILGTLSGYALHLHVDKGYWDSWEDRRGKIEADVKQYALDLGADQTAAEHFAACYTDNLLEVLISVECPVPTLDVMSEAIFACTADETSMFFINQGVIECVVEAQEVAAKQRMNSEDSNDL